MSVAGNMLNRSEGEGTLPECTRMRSGATATCQVSEALGFAVGKRLGKDLDKVSNEECSRRVCFPRFSDFCVRVI